MVPDHIVQIAGFILVVFGIVIVLGAAAVWVYLLTRNTAEGSSGSPSSQNDADAQ